MYRYLHINARLTLRSAVEFMNGLMNLTDLHSLHVEKSLRVLIPLIIFHHQKEVITRTNPLLEIYPKCAKCSCLMSNSCLDNNVKLSLNFSLFLIIFHNSSCNNWVCVVFMLKQTRLQSFHAKLKFASNVSCMSGSTSLPFDIIHHNDPPTVLVLCAACLKLIQ